MIGSPSKTWPATSRRALPAITVWSAAATIGSV
jgi:hypothetical protein